MLISLLSAEAAAISILRSVFNFKAASEFIVDIVSMFVMALNPVGVQSQTVTRGSSKPSSATVSSNEPSPSRSPSIRVVGRFRDVL
ncbi:hypothetical protein DSECCO2_527850 [anaerobic digester metagenome]